VKTAKSLTSERPAGPEEAPPSGGDEAVMTLLSDGGA